MSRGENLSIRDLVTSAEAGGYTLPPEVLAAYATLVRVQETKISAPLTLRADTAAARVVTAVSSGEEVDLMAIAHEVGEAVTDGLAHDQARGILNLAAEQAGDRATNLCATLVEKIITEHLAPALEQVYAQARDLAAALDGHSIDNPHALVTAPAKVRNAYAALPELVARRTTIFTARRLINFIGHREVKHDVAGLYAEFKTPLALYPTLPAPTSRPGRIPTAPEDPAARLLWAAGPDAAPGHPWLPTMAEQDAAWMDQFGEAAAQRANRSKSDWPRVMTA